MRWFETIDEHAVNSAAAHRPNQPARPERGSKKGTIMGERRGTTSQTSKRKERGPRRTNAGRIEWIGLRLWKHGVSINNDSGIPRVFSILLQDCTENADGICAAQTSL
ncbi:uncharacterized protein LOC115234288 [Formica exsecta]|uniref:uncharacterized protein LOC115234288 n=1 Tax=Formica exsecta TaxID=72781 RepID=UPI0011440AE6|nr:uncharacterized protein LOC115234288 [Formica exsecta]